MFTLQQALTSVYGDVSVYSFPQMGACIIVENSNHAWAFAIKDNAAKLIKHVNKLTDPLNDTRDTIEPEDFVYATVPGITPSAGYIGTPGGAVFR